MAATDFSWGGYPVTGGDIPVKNTDSADFVAGDALKPDGTNVISGSQPVIGALQCTTDDAAMGIAVEAIKQNNIGRVRVYGVAIARASGAITAGGFVQCDASAQIKAAGTAKPGLGMALATTASNHDPVPVLLHLAKNA